MLQLNRSQSVCLSSIEAMSRWQKTENGWKKSEAPLPEQKKPEAPNLAVPVAAEPAALPKPQVSHASVRKATHDAHRAFAPCTLPPRWKHAAVPAHEMSLLRRCIIQRSPK